MIYHAVNSIPKAIRNRTMAGELLWIEGWRNERYVSNPDLPQYMKIPRSSIPYLSKGNTGFEIDLDFSVLLNKVSGSQEEVLDQVEEELEKNRGFEDEREALKKRKKELRKQVIEKGIELRRESLTSAQVADELRAMFSDADFITPRWVKENIPSGGTHTKN
jgi:multidrug efflux pump subunit AcrB